MSTVKHGLEAWEVKFAATICILGWFFSRKFWVNWLNWVDPVIGLLSWYIVMAAFIWIWIHGKHVQVGVTAIKQWGWMTTLGALMIMYAFWMVFNWTESQLPSIYAGMGENVPNTLLASVEGKSRIMIKNKKTGIIRTISIGDFVHYVIQRKISFVDYDVLAFNRKGECLFRPIRGVGIHPQIGQLLRIKALGREISLTNNHSVFSIPIPQVKSRSERVRDSLGRYAPYPQRHLLFEDRMQLKQAGNLDSERDRILAAQTAPSNPQVTEIDMLAYAWNDQTCQKILGIELSSTLAPIAFGHASQIPISNRDGRWYYTQGFLKHYTGLRIYHLKKLKVPLSEIPRDTNICGKASSQTLPRIIPFDVDLARLIGYYVAEGSLFQDGIKFTLGKKDDDGEKEILDDIIRISQSKFGITPAIYFQTTKRTTPTYDVRIHSRVVRFLFARIFEFERKDARTKTIPHQLFNTTKPIREAFLSAYAKGDGYKTPPPDNAMCATTASQALAYDLLYLGLQDKQTFASSSFIQQSGYNKGQEYWRVRMLKETDFYQHFNEESQDLISLKIRKIEHIAHESPFVYDLSVGEPHETDNFIANGICCHNTEDGVVFFYIYRWAKTLSYPVFWWSTPVSLTADLTYVVIPPLLILIAGAFFVTASRMRRIVGTIGV